jgi:hypothetical protein
MCEGIAWSDYLYWLSVLIASYYSIVGYNYRKELLQWLERKRDRMN